MPAFNCVKILVIYSEVIIIRKYFPVFMSIVIFVILFSLDNPTLKFLRQQFNKFIFIQALNAVDQGFIFRGNRIFITRHKFQDIRPNTKLYSLAFIIIMGFCKVSDNFSKITTFLHKSCKPNKLLIHSQPIRFITRIIPILVSLYKTSYSLSGRSNGVSYFIIIHLLFINLYIFLGIFIPFHMLTISYKCKIRWFCNKPSPVLAFHQELLPF